MPYIKSITFIFFIASLIFPIIGDTYPLDFVLYVILFSFFIWLLALLDDFLSSLIALILSAFFTQRMLMLYLDPTVFSYQWVTNDQITLSVLFCLLAVLGVYFGSLTYSLTSNKPQNIAIDKDDIYLKNQNFRTLVGNIDINTFIKASSYLVLIGITINLYLAITSNVGIASITADRMGSINLSFIEKLLSRIGPFFTYLFMFTLIVFVKKDNFSKRTILLVYFTTFMYVLFDLVIVTSKGTFIWLAFTLLIINQLVKGYVSKVIVRRAAYVVIVSVVFLFALIGILRPLISDWFLSDGINVDRLLYGVEISFFDAISQFSNRLSAFDWLAGIMAYQGDLFSYSGTFLTQIISTINSYLPGELIQEDYMPITQAMPIYLDDQPLNTTTRELPGGLSIMFLSFGWGSCFVYYLMMLLLRFVQNSDLHIFYKLIIFTNFTLSHFTGGLSTFSYLTDRILAIIICILIVKISIYFVRDFNRYLIVR